MGAMIGSEAQQRAFRDRLTRISAGGENTTRHVYIGPVDENRRHRPRRVKSLRGGSRTFLGELFIVPFAMFMGALSVLATRLVAFHFLNDIPAYADVAVYASIGIALVLFFILHWIFRLGGGARGKAAIVGFLGFAFFESLVIVRAPELFAVLYSEPFVAQVIALVGQV